MTDYWLPIAMAIVFGYMLWKYPTGATFDPFPYETRTRTWRRRK